MGWGDDFLKGLQQTAQTAAQSVVQTGGQFLESQVQNTLVKIGAKPTGNLTAAEVESGERGGPAATAVSIVSNPKALLPIALIGGALAFLFLRRRR